MGQNKVQYDRFQQPTICCPACQKAQTLTADRRQEMIDGTTLNCSCGAVISIKDNQAGLLQPPVLSQNAAYMPKAPKPPKGKKTPPEPQESPDTPDWSNL